MSDLKDKMKKAINSNFSPEDASEKCEQLSREHTIKVLDNLLCYRGSSSDRMYIAILKAQMAVKLKEV